MNSVLARNIMIHAQVADIASALSGGGVPAVLLKGAALIERFPEYMSWREMEDIDLMFRPADIGKAREILGRLGYRPAPEDPWAFVMEGAPAYVDTSDGLWYASRRENEDLWLRSARFTLDCGLRHLPPEEFYAHVLAHAAVHHGTRHGKWMSDLELIKRKWDLERTGLAEGVIMKYGLAKAEEACAGGELSGIYRALLDSDIPLKGHALRFLFLPPAKKAGYALRSLFPDGNFLRHRYGLKNGFETFVFRLARPLLLAKNLLKFLLSSFPARRPA